MDKQFADERNKAQRTSLGNFILCITLDFFMQSKTTLAGHSDRAV
jgi:hypothetical protein